MTNDKSLGFKKKVINYIDIVFSIVNFLIILFPLIFFRKNIFISIFGFLFSGVLIINMLYTFTKNNPLYIYYSYALLFCGIFFLIPSIMINYILGWLLIPELCYVYNISKARGQTSATSQMAKLRVLGRAGGYGLNIRRMRQTWDNVNPELELKRTQQREIFEKQYNGKKNLITSSLLGLSLIIVFVVYIVTSVLSNLPNI
ncbi:MAG TPA: hypothetical protein ENH75_02170 [archaeon]|nr:hypothetical protein [archaeon]